MPEVAPADGVRIRVLCGESNGITSPFSELLTPITLLDIHLKPNTTATHELPDNQFALAMVIQGDALIGTPAHLTNLAHHQAVAFDQDGDVVQFTAGSVGANLLFAAGVPTGKNNVWVGPFCLSSKQKADDCIRRYEIGLIGLMGSLSPSC